MTFKAPKPGRSSSCLFSFSFVFGIGWRRGDEMNGKRKERKGRGRGRGHGIFGGGDLSSAGRVKS